MIPDIIWDVWYYFILYAIWIFFGIDLIYKVSYFKKLRVVLGKNFNSYPDVSNIKLWRKIMLVFLVITAVAMIVTAIIYEMDIYLSILIFIITGLVYINGKLRNNILSYKPTIFWNDKGFSIFPMVYRLKSPVFTYDKIDSVNFIKKGSTEFGVIKSKNKKYKFVVYGNIKSILNTINTEYKEILSNQNK